jgi:hypothetical protein
MLLVSTSLAASRLRYRGVQTAVEAVAAMRSRNRRAELTPRMKAVLRRCSFLQWIMWVSPALVLLSNGLLLVSLRGLVDSTFGGLANYSPARSRQAVTPVIHRNMA